jgi:hypothetical protein
MSKEYLNLKKDEEIGTMKEIMIRKKQKLREEESKLSLKKESKFLHTEIWLMKLE